MTPQDKAFELIDNHKLTHKNHIRNDSLAKAMGIKVDEAQGYLDKYRTLHGERVRGQQLELIQEVADEPKKKHTVHTILDWMIDGGALALAVVIDLVLNVVVFVTIAPDALTRVGMAGLAFLVVLFSVRGWIKGGVSGKALWALFALVTIFSDVSFALYTTDVQSRTATDTELVRLKEEAVKASSYLESLQSLQLEKGQGYAQQVKDAREALGKANEAVSGHVTVSSVALTASGVFSAIPDAVTRGRWIELTFFSLIFLGLALTIISAAGIVKEPVDTDHDRV